MKQINGFSKLTDSELILFYANIRVIIALKVDGWRGETLKNNAILTELISRDLITKEDAEPYYIIEEITA